MLHPEYHLAECRSDLSRKQSGRRLTEPGAALRGDKRGARPRRASYAVGTSAVSAAMAVAQATPLGQRKISFKSAVPHGTDPTWDPGMSRDSWRAPWSAAS